MNSVSSQQEKGNKQREMKHAIIYLHSFVAVSVLLILCCFVGSCRSTQHTTHQKSTLTTYRDTTVYRYHFDTIYITKYDTLHKVIEINDSIHTQRTIDFNAGGTYNAHTGDMAGVKRISEQTTATTKTNAQSVQMSHTDSTARKADTENKIGIISNEQSEERTEQEPKPCNRLRIFLIGLVIGIVLPYLLKYAYRLAKIVARAYGIQIP